MSRACHADAIPSDTLDGQKRNAMWFLHCGVTDPFDSLLKTLSGKMLIRQCQIRRFAEPSCPSLDGLLTMGLKFKTPRKMGL